MATAVATDIRAYVGALDLTALCESATIADLEAAEVSFTNFAAGGFKETKTGIISGAASLNLFQDYAAGVLDDSLTVGSQYTMSMIVPATPGTVAEGDIAFLGTGNLKTYTPRDGSVGEAAKATLEMPYTGRIAWGVVGHPLAARTTSSNTTGFAYAGPGATRSLYAAIHVTAYSGLTNIVVKVQSDDNSGFTSPTDRLTFSTITGIGAEFTSAVGSSGWASETHHRVLWTVTGAGSCTFAVTFGIL